MKVGIGDLIEINTNKGFAYALYTHRHDKPPRFGALLRVFDELHSSRPRDINDVASGLVRLTLFFPLQAAVDRGLVEVIGNVSVPESLQAFPTFRSGMVNPQTKKVESWWLWNGEREWPVGALTPEQRMLPIRGVWNDAILVQRIEEGWRPENDPSSL
jgi:hypothetical protein